MAEGFSIEFRPAGWRIEPELFIPGAGLDVLNTVIDDLHRIVAARGGVVASVDYRHTPASVGDQSAVERALTVAPSTPSGDSSA